jgi:hypothetical protein
VGLPASSGQRAWSRSAVSLSSLTGTIGSVHISHAAGGRRTKRISARLRRLRHRRHNAMANRCCEFVDSRLRRCPPDRASAVTYGQGGENAMRFPHLAHRSAAAHKLHRATASSRIEFDSGKGETFSRRPALAYSSRNLSERPGPPQFIRNHSMYVWNRINPNLLSSGVVTYSLHRRSNCRPRARRPLPHFVRKRRQIGLLVTTAIRSGTIGVDEHSSYRRSAV